MCLRRTLMIVCCLIGLLYLIRQPIAAAHTVTAIMHALAKAADALGRFGSAL